MSRPRMDHACARVGRDVVVFGGESSELLNLDSMTWSKGPGTGGVYFATSQVYQTAETFFNVGGSYDEDATEKATSDQLSLLLSDILSSMDEYEEVLDVQRWGVRALGSIVQALTTGEPFPGASVRALMIKSLTLH